MATQVKKALKVTGELIATILICAAVGYILLFLVYLIPADKLEPNVRSSAAVFEIEGRYPTVNTPISGSHMLDNNTDSLMILTAAYPGDTSLVDRTVNTYHEAISGLNATEVLISQYGHIKFNNNPIYYEGYGRYWHGYLTVLKPLLCLTDYHGIRYLNTFLLIISVGILVFLLYKKQMKQYIIPYLLVLFILDPFAIVNSLQYSSIYYITSVCSIILLMKMDKWDNDIGKYVILFTVTGCLSSYFDLLTYPLVSFGIPIVLYLCKNKDSLIKNIKTFLCLSVSWGAGYSCMWILKWVIGGLLTSGDLLNDALSSVAFRTSNSTAGGASITLLTIINRNFELLKTPVGMLALIYAIILLIIVIIHIKSILSNNQKLSGLLFLVIGFLPILWYAVVSNHSYIHPFFTYRELAITVFAILCMLTKYTGMFDRKTNKWKMGKH